MAGKRHTPARHSARSVVSAIVELTAKVDGIKKPPRGGECGAARSVRCRSGETLAFAQRSACNSVLPVGAVAALVLRN